MDSTSQIDQERLHRKTIHRCAMWLYVVATLTVMPLLLSVLEISIVREFIARIAPRFDKMVPGAFLVLAPFIIGLCPALCALHGYLTVLLATFVCLVIPPQLYRESFAGSFFFVGIFLFYAANAMRKGDVWASKAMRWFYRVDNAIYALGIIPFLYWIHYKLTAPSWRPTFNWGTLIAASALGILLRICITRSISQASAAHKALEEMSRTP